MTWHPTDDDLILRFYKEDPDHEALVDKHLASCDSCRQSWDDIQDTLRHVDAATVPEPDPGFERVMWARIQPQLAGTRRQRRWAWPWLVPAAGLLAATAVIAVIGWRVAVGSHSLTASAVKTAAAAPAGEAKHAARTRERVLLSALDEHFEETQILLTELMNAPGTAADVGFARETADDLLASGRLYRATARQTGHAQLAATLDDLESVLVDVARSPDTMEQANLESLRSRIADASLLFKVRAASLEVRERQKVLASSTE